MKLEVIQKKDGTMECYPEGATGSPIVGRGMSVIEAVGDWCIHSAHCQVTCNPPAILHEYRVALAYEDLEFSSGDKRD